MFQVTNRQALKPRKMEAIECLGILTGNCVMVAGLQKSIKYNSQTRALLCKGEKTIDVFTWPGAQAGLCCQTSLWCVV
ncbi:uncharacterized protein VP01_9734g1 [Puccinia sorghi]|uniref:Uncharacterized protein n=1 Tax=Puccinia sorghi TaxID=27349 RepID=A0A0L6U5W2_9BASI|nr:uncharacterized protein VP01_9734g1 [Puccinia sorghi]